MRIETVEAVVGDRLEEAWKVYLSAFEHLRHTAVQRHVLYAEEFDGLMADPRVLKYLAFDDEDRVTAIATFTNVLETMTLVSPEYFEHRWPEAYRDGKIWYIGFTAVHPHAHGTGAFAEIVSQMTKIVSKVDGVAVVDICRRNDEVFKFPTAIARLIRSHAPHMRDHNLDAQTYYAYDFARVG
jgi:hypothetical protein